MSVDGKVVDFYMQNGQPHSIINVTLVKSPKYGVLSEIKAFIQLFNEVARKYQGVELIEILEKDDTELKQ
ncbi:hypothetical protein [uncultured Nostoc sp.]|uniref:hypothetical protein n=1 Tax=uncultured Nostoc sp. TaxID=340711 RepID=UPI0035CBAEEF